MTKKVYDLGTFRLLQNQTIESKFGSTTRESTYQKLRSCHSSDKFSISKIVHDSKLPDSTLFKIADKIQNDDLNIELAHAIRETSRSFNLQSAVEHIYENLTSHCIKKDLAELMATEFSKKFINGDYEHIYDEEDFANTVTQDLQSISHNRHVFVLSKPPIAESEISSAQKIFVSKGRIKELEASKFGFGDLQTPPNGTAYLDILSFENPKELIEGNPVTRDFALANLKHIVDSKPEALIIDLRKHGGGSVYMSELILSHFLAEGLPLTREVQGIKVKKITVEIQQQKMCSIVL